MDRFDFYIFGFIFLQILHVFFKWMLPQPVSLIVAILNVLFFILIMLYPNLKSRLFFQTRYQYKQLYIFYKVAAFIIGIGVLINESARLWPPVIPYIVRGLYLMATGIFITAHVCLTAIHKANARHHFTNN